jgi:enamine deaminase RidA (YjgF/YER057c/UK114 family)
MARIEQRLATMGLSLPPPLQPPQGVVLPFRFVRVVGRRALVAGHGPQADDGRVALSMLGSLQRELGDLDRVRAWARIFGMVNSAPGFDRQPAVVNGCSDLILELWGPEAGAHARSAVGMAELPFGIPVEIEAEVEIAD